MTDVFTIRLVVIGLATLTAASVIGAIVLAIADKEPAQAWQLAGTLGGALAGILVQTKTQPDPATSEAIEKVAIQANAAGAAQKEADVTRYLARPLRGK